MDSKLRREIILEHYQNPVNRGLVDDHCYLKVNTSSDSCIDNLDFMMKIEDGIIKEKELIKNDRLTIITRT